VIRANRAARADFLAVFLILLPATASTTSSIPQVTINLYNDAHVADGILVQAQQEASRIFHDAGVESIWLECRSFERGTHSTSACSSPPAGVHFSLRIVPWASRLGDAVFGSAFLSDLGLGAYSDVFYPSVERLHTDWGTSLPRVLGNVMAHEIGHLLLGTSAHSASGIMRPHWQGEELRSVAMGTLLFTPQQVRHMRARLLRISAETTPSPANGLR
jgi:hypothetical protein